jgi:hypothetical protein
MNISKMTDNQIWSMLVGMEIYDFMQYTPQHLQTIEDICIDYADEIENIFGVQITEAERYYIYENMVKYLIKRHGSYFGRE